MQIALGAVVYAPILQAVCDKKGCTPTSDTGASKLAVTLPIVTVALNDTHFYVQLDEAHAFISYPTTHHGKLMEAYWVAGLSHRQ